MVVVVVVVMTTISLVGWEVAGVPTLPTVMGAVIVSTMTRISATAVRSVTVPAAARAFPVMPILGPRSRTGARRTARGRRVGTLPLAAAAVLGGLVLIVLGRAGGRRLVGILFAIAVDLGTILALALVGGVAVGSLGCLGRTAARPGS